MKSRQDIVDLYNNNPKYGVFLLSTRAGGMGINLTAADTVILHDLDFNPSIDRQAEDRCHRMGQTKKVTVYKMLTDNTVDSAIFETQIRKKELDHQVLQNETHGSERMLAFGGFVNPKAKNDDEGAQTSKIMQMVLGGEKKKKKTPKSKPVMDMVTKAMNTVATSSVPPVVPVVAPVVPVVAPVVPVVAPVVPVVAPVVPVVAPVVPVVAPVVPVVAPVVPVVAPVVPVVTPVVPVVPVVAPPALVLPVETPYFAPATAPVTLPVVVPTQGLSTTTPERPESNQTLTPAPTPQLEQQ